MDNATTLLESLNADEIRQRLSDMTAEQKALRALLRAAVHLERQGNRASTVRKYSAPITPPIEREDPSEQK